MVRMVKGEDVIKVQKNGVVPFERIGYKIEETELTDDEKKQAIKDKLDELGVEYHHSLGLKNLTILLKENS